MGGLQAVPVDAPEGKVFLPSRELLVKGLKLFFLACEKQFLRSSKTGVGHLKPPIFHPQEKVPDILTCGIFSCFFKFKSL